MVEKKPTSRALSATQNSWRQPSFDANPSVGSHRSIGSVDNPGLYARIRYTCPVTRPLMDAYAEHVLNLTWVAEPQDEGDPEAEMAAAVVQEILDSTVARFSEHVSLMADSVKTYGHYVCEVLEQPTDELAAGFFYDITTIPAFSIDSWDPTQTGLSWRTLTQRTTRSMTKFTPEEVLHYISDESIPGNFLGNSALRALVLPFTASEIDIKTYLDQRLGASGTWVLRPVDGEAKGVEEWAETLQVMRAASEGKSRVIALPEWVEAKWEQGASPQPALENWQYYDSLKRAALGELTQNLGLAGSGSNRALGEVLLDVDADSWQAEIRRLERLLNSPRSIVHRYIQALEIPKDKAPRIKARYEKALLPIEDVLERLKALSDIEEFLDEAEFKQLKTEILSGRVDPANI